jgi:hypothetical protein
MKLSDPDEVATIVMSNLVATEIMTGILGFLKYDNFT